MLRFRGESPAARRDTSLCMPPTPPAVDALTASVAFSVAPALWTAILICGPAQRAGVEAGDQHVHGRGARRDRVLLGEEAAAGEAVAGVIGD